MIETEKQKRFLKAYQPVEDNIRRYCLFMTKNRERAEDLLSETIVQAYTGFESISEQKAFLSWLFTIASRTFYRNKRISEKYHPDEYDFDKLFNSDLLPDVRADLAFLYEGLNKLTVEQKETIILSSIEGFSRSVIAKMQGVSEETVKSRLARGKKKLAEILGVENEE